MHHVALSRFRGVLYSPLETMATLRQSIAFVDRVKPHDVIWNPFTLLPGTAAFHKAEQQKIVAREQFFTEDFFELIPLERDASRPDRELMLSWLRSRQGLQRMGSYGVRELATILRLFPDLHSAHLDCAHAYLREGRLHEAQHALEQAALRGYPQPGIIENYRACIAALQGDIREALARVLAAKKYGFHAVVEKNIASAQAWIRAGGQDSGRPLELEADNSFEVTRPLQQPMTPGRSIGQSKNALE